MTAAELLPAADILVKVTIVLGVAALVSRALARRSAAVRHHVWTLALVATLILPILTTIAPQWRIAVLPTTAVRLSAIATATADEKPDTRNEQVRLKPHATYTANATATQQTNIADTSAPVAPTPGLMPASAESLPPTDITAIVTPIWIGGALLLLARVAFGSVRIWWIARRARPAGVWAPLASQLAASLGIRRHVIFVSGEADAMPMAWGLIRSRVLLPAEADEWPASRQRVVLLHELAHVKRRDCVTQLAAHLACAAYWFNPLVWVAARRLRAEREHACDDLVLAAGTRGSEYADHLLDIARSLSAAAWPTWSAVTMAHRSQLEGRLMAILDPALSRRSPTRGSVAVVAALAVVGVTSLAVVRPVAKEAEVPVTAAAPVATAPQPADVPTIAPRHVTANAAQGRPARPVMPTPTPAPTPAPTITPMPAPMITPFAPTIVQVPFPDVRIDGDAIGRAVEQGLDSAFRQGGPRASSADPRVVAALSAALKDDDKEVRQQALHALVSMRAPIAADAYIGLLKDSDPEVRKQAVFALGQLRDPKHFDVLMSALKDQNGEVRHQAAFALGQLRDPRAVDPLVGLLKDTDPEVRKQAAFALGQIRDRRAIDPLIAALKDANPEVRRQAAFALGQLR